MSKSKDKKAAAPAAAPEVKYNTARLLRSKALSGYQQDFARVILTAPEYTLSEAFAALDAVLKKEE
jgi:hypothetical protein